MATKITKHKIGEVIESKKMTKEKMETPNTLDALIETVPGLITIKDYQSIGKIGAAHGGRYLIEEMKNGKTEDEAGFTPEVVEKFFFHVANITYSEVELPKIAIGMYVTFTPSNAPVRKPGDAPFATDIRVYSSEASMAAANLAAIAGSKEVAR